MCKIYFLTPWGPQKSRLTEDNLKFLSNQFFTHFNFFFLEA